MDGRHNDDMLPLSKALLYIFLTTVFVSGSATLGWLYYLQQKHERAHDDDYLVNAIVQTGPQKEALPTEYLAELLQLSADRPTNLYQLDLDEAEAALLSSPLISEAHVRRLRPSTVYIDYTRRQPVAYLVDFENALIDSEGVAFPAAPYFTPRRIPEIILGSRPQIEGWGEQLMGKEIDFALEIYHYLEADQMINLSSVRRIDVSEAFAESYGSREVIVVLEETVHSETEEGFVDHRYPHTLRLSTDTWQEGVVNYHQLLEYLSQHPSGYVIDLRTPQLALLSADTE